MLNGCQHGDCGVSAQHKLKEGQHTRAEALCVELHVETLVSVRWVLAAQARRLLVALTSPWLVCVEPWPAQKSRKLLLFLSLSPFTEEKIEAYSQDLAPALHMLSTPGKAQSQEPSGMLWAGLELGAQHPFIVQGRRGS